MELGSVDIAGHSHTQQCVFAVSNHRLPRHRVQFVTFVANFVAPAGHHSFMFDSTGQGEQSGAPDQTIHEWGAVSAVLAEYDCAQTEIFAAI